MANIKIACTLGRGQAHIFGMSSTSGYMSENDFQEFDSRLFDMSSASGYMGGKNIFRNLVPDFWRVMSFLARHVLNVACHGMSISIVSISSVYCRVRILRVSVSMPCRGHLANIFWGPSCFGKSV